MMVASLDLLAMQILAGDLRQAVELAALTARVEALVGGIRS